MSSMIVTRRVTFRLYPNKSQEAKMHYWRRLHKDLFNACIAERKTAYQREGRSINYFDQQNALPKFKEHFSDYKELGSQALQATVKRVDFAYQRFFQGLGKYPRFKSSRYYRGWTYPGIAGWKTHTNGGTGAVGLDIGTLTAIAFDNGDKIDNPRFLASAQSDIRKASKELRRKRKPEKGKAKASRRWKKARKKVSKLQNNVANRRQDWTHKVVASALVCLNWALGTSVLDAEQKALAKTPHLCGGFSQLSARKRQKPRT